MMRWIGGYCRWDKSHGSDVIKEQLAQARPARNETCRAALRKCQKPRAAHAHPVYYMNKWR